MMSAHQVLQFLARQLDDWNEKSGVKNGNVISVSVSRLDKVIFACSGGFTDTGKYDIGVGQR